MRKLLLLLSVLVCFVIAAPANAGFSDGGDPPTGLGKGGLRTAPFLPVKPAAIAAYPCYPNPPCWPLPPKPSA